jgi:hypothetical protein
VNAVVSAEKRERPRFARVLLALAHLGVVAGCPLPFDVPLDVVPPGPATPELAEPVTPTASSTTILRGTRPANTSLLIDDVEVIARDGSTAFRLVLPLAPGFNTFALQTLDAAGRISEPRVVTVVYDDVAPSPIVFEVPPPARTARVRLTLRGTKDPSCTLRQDGRPRGDVESAAPFFVIEQDIDQGVNRFRWACVDDAGNEGPVTRFDVERFAVADIPFSIDPTPATTTEATLLLSATCDDDVEVHASGVGAAPCVDGQWNAAVTLVDGLNTIVVRAAFLGELDAAAKSTTVTVDAALEGG